jgi:8-oxo-dGTP pyrophosphatase MutT (NUDIX family)
MLEKEIFRVIADYLDRFPEDFGVARELRDFASTTTDITNRKQFRGHVTCSGIIVDPNSQVLVIHHRVLGKWLFPGGHIEETDASMRDAAIREIVEETGLDRQTLLPTESWLDHVPIHIDRHLIPANIAHREPEHRHFDFRYVFVGTLMQVSPSTEEVQDWAWVKADKAPKRVFERLRQFHLV